MALVVNSEFTSCVTQTSYISKTVTGIRTKFLGGLRFSGIEIGKDEKVTL
jgi:hypothetical protein